MKNFQIYSSPACLRRKLTSTLIKVAITAPPIQMVPMPTRTQVAVPTMTRERVMLFTSESHHSFSVNIDELI